MFALYLLITALCFVGLAVHPWWLFVTVAALFAIWGGAVALDAGGTGRDVRRRAPAWISLGTVRIIGGGATVLGVVLAHRRLSRVVSDLLGAQKNPSGVRGGRTAKVISAAG